MDLLGRIKSGCYQTPPVRPVYIPKTAKLVWQAPDVHYVQFLGKDNVPFHTVSFPATLLGSGEPWKTVDVIKASIG